MLGYENDKFVILMQQRLKEIEQTIINNHDRLDFYFPEKVERIKKTIIEAQEPIQKESLHEIARHIYNYFGNCDQCPLRHNELDICYDDQNFNTNQFEEWFLKRLKQT